jgi:hypothetical protein
LTPIEIKQALIQILVAKNKAEVLLVIFGSTENMQFQLRNHIDSFVEGVIQITTEVFKPIISSRGGLPDREIMAKLLDNSFEDLIKHNAETGYFSKEQAQPIIDIINTTQEKSPLALDYFRYSLSCFLNGLTNAGKKYLALALLEIANNERLLGTVFRDAQLSEFKSKAASLAGKKGKDKRWEAKEKTRLYAIEMFKSKSYKNANQAAEDITEKVFEYGKTVGFHFTAIYQANKTIYKWLLAYKNNK